MCKILTHFFEKTAKIVLPTGHNFRNFAIDMNVETVRETALQLPMTTERCPYGPDVLAIEIGGKQFCLLDLSSQWQFFNLKVDPELASELCESHNSIRPGWHMNKRHWISVDFSGDTSETLQRDLVVHSFWHTASCLTAKKRRELRLPSPELALYIEREIIPRYDSFDKAHQRDHARAVIRRSLDLSARMPGLDADMVYAVAAFHDTGLSAGRENHHHESRSIIESDPFIRDHFSPTQINQMGMAVEDHRASSSNRPRNDYGLVVAEADRLIDTHTIIRRTVQYGLSHYPELDREGHFRRTVDHLVKKYGPEGYLAVWLPWSENSARLKELHRTIADPDAVRALFDQAFDSETDAATAEQQPGRRQK